MIKIRESVSCDQTAGVTDHMFASNFLRFILCNEEIRKVFAEKIKLMNFKFFTLIFVIGCLVEIIR